MLNKASTKYIDFLDKNIIYKKNTPIVNIFKIKYFSDIYNKYKSILSDTSLINKNDIKFIEIVHNPSSYIGNTHFISNNVLEYINTRLKYTYKITFENNTIIYSTINKKNVMKVPSIIIHLLTIIKSLKILFNRTYENQMLVFFETLLKKNLPKKKSSKTQNIMSLGPNEINSGLTYVENIHNGKIVLFRKEEILKVLIHELIHSNRIDNILIKNNLNIDLNKLFCSNYNILLHEAVTETLATIIHTFYINILLLNKSLDKSIMYEIYYSNYISSKIMNYYKITSIKDIIKNNNICNTEFSQETNIFSYYILKNILLKNMMEFGNILLRNSVKGSYSIINDNCYKDITILIKNKIQDFKIIYGGLSDSSLRMVLHELNI